jgi:hypothetical protein
MASAGSRAPRVRSGRRGTCVGCVQRGFIAFAITYRPIALRVRENRHARWL